MVDLTCERLLPSDRLEVLHHDVMKWPLEDHVGALLAQRGGHTRAKVPSCSTSTRCSRPVAQRPLLSA